MPTASKNGEKMIQTVDTAAERMLLWFECSEFLSEEAERLDDDRVEDWLELLTPDVRYEIPVRVTRHRGEDSIAARSWHMKEDLGSLQTRVARLGTASAWGEDPASRTRRLIGNVRCGAVRDDDDDGDEVDVKSNLLLYRGRGDSYDHVLLAAERRDVLRRTDDGFRLARRCVWLAHTTLPTQNLGVFL